jgi:hypothetical protein
MKSRGWLVTKFAGTEALSTKSIQRERSSGEDIDGVVRLAQMLTIHASPTR